MLSLSIIVPLRGSVELFEDTLVSILQNRPPDCEVIVVTQGEYNDPYGLAGEVNFAAAPNECGLPEQINAGVRASRSEIIHVVQSGLTVVEGWTEAALGHFRNRSVGAVVPVVVREAQDSLMAGVRSSFSGRRVEVLTKRSDQARNRSIARCDGPALVAGFWRKSAWERVGGLDPTFGPRFADLDLAIALQAFGFQCVVEHQSRLIELAIPKEHASAWSDGRLTGKLFRKHAGCGGRHGSRLRHLIGLAAEFLAAAPRPRRLLELTARLTALGGGLFGRGESGRDSRTSRTDSMADVSSGNDVVRRRDGASLLAECDRRTAGHRNAVQPY